MSSKIGNQPSSTLGACLMRFTQPVCRSLRNHIHGKVRPQQACCSHNCCCCNRQRGRDLAQQWQWPLFSLRRRPLGSLSRPYNIYLRPPPMKSDFRVQFFLWKWDACMHMGRGWASRGVSDRRCCCAREKVLEFLYANERRKFRYKNEFLCVCVWRHSARSQTRAYSNKYSNYIPCNLGQGICL